MEVTVHVQRQAARFRVQCVTCLQLMSGYGPNWFRYQLSAAVQLVDNKDQESLVAIFTGDRPLGRQSVMDPGREAPTNSTHYPAKALSFFERHWSRYG